MQQLTLEEKIGQLFMGGFQGSQPTEEFIRLIENRKLGNVILFSHNIENKKQTVQLNGRLTQLIEENTGIRPLISLDEEGGAVSRLPSDCAIMPSAKAQARLGDRELIRKGARIVAEECLALGFNFNLAPVLDIHTNRQNPGIGTRSYGDTAEQVADIAGEITEEYLKAGMMCCGKHFPGSGDVLLDSHLDLPTLNADWPTLEKRELAAFSGVIRRGLPAIMISHMLVPAIEEEHIPCTISTKAITGVLREKLHFDGLIMSDCLEMNAIKDFYGIERSAVAALNAGMDLLCISHTPAYIESSIQEIYRALENGKLTEERIDRAVGHILEAKSKYVGRGRLDPELAITAERLAFADGFFRRTILLEKGEQPFALGENPLFAGVENLGLTAIDNPDKRDFARSLKGRLGGTAVTLSREPSETDIAAVRKAFEGKTALVLGTFNGHLSEGQKKLIALAGKFPGPVCHVALRNPYDIEYSSGRCTKIALYEYTERALRLAAEMLTAAHC